jgi:hypothetical protein
LEGLMASKYKEKKKKGGEYAVGAFAGNCFDCQQKGHKAGDAKCPKKGAGGKKKNKKDFKKKAKACDTCGKTHNGPFWEDQRNTHLRPKGWKSSKTGEVSAAAVQTEKGDEMLLCGMCLDP